MTASQRQAEARQKCLAIATALKGRRLELGLSQHDLARRMRKGANTIYEWETGRYPPVLDNLIRWAEALGIDVATILHSAIMPREWPMTYWKNLPRQRTSPHSLHYSQTPKGLAPVQSGVKSPPQQAEAT